MTADPTPRAPSVPEALNPRERPPLPAAASPMFGSDAIAQTLAALDIPYIALNPGASFRGLHDSLVNHLGNRTPQMLLCLHEEHAVALAHGYAKVTGKAMAAAVHANVGLMHATMAVFNAWCDRMPLLLLGATGHLDAARRRPWIEWIHTARDQGALVRDFTKWDDQPASPAAARESLFRAKWLSESAPQAPVYVNLDVDVQEQALREPLPPANPADFLPEARVGASARQIAALAALIRRAQRPVLLMGRVSRCAQAWAQRLRLAEGIGARVLTDLKVGAAFPTDHPLHAGTPGIYADAAALGALKKADLVISLDWVDLAGLLREACADGRPAARIVQVSVDAALHRGWSMDYQALPAVDLCIRAEPELLVADLNEALGLAPRPGEAHAPVSAPAAPAVPAAAGQAPLLSMAELAHGLRECLAGREVSLTHLPLGWDGALWPFHHPLDFLGSDGGGGVGAGPGLTVGAALALRGSSRVPLGICGDGDFLMGATALWTAVHYRIPLICVVANNQSFFNDEVHQERVARMRGRAVDNKWIGQRITDPDVDIAGLARAQGAAAYGPVATPRDLAQACASALRDFDQGRVAVIDARIASGYTPAMTNALTEQGAD
ncbi:thiamine pyrophosphate-binding protein [Castellaniella defragrans]|uniref:thiamine pyrophosphate-binding protein n=1 Tax=Castellaniella defragrans TaxID=75697 RepID=UPI002AFF9991|nr:thiamine pyrophosphate-binding protein [Castellaniella defragrans]